MVQECRSWRRCGLILHSRHRFHYLTAPLHIKAPTASLSLWSFSTSSFPLPLSSPLTPAAAARVSPSPFEVHKALGLDVMMAMRSEDESMDTQSLRSFVTFNTSFLLFVCD